MGFTDRTPDNAGDVGRAADQQASVDNDDFFKVIYVEIVIIDWAADNEVADGQYYFHVPPKLDGMDLTYVHAEVITAGITGTQDIQIHNIDNVLDMLSTKLTLDTTETGSDTAAVPAVINTSNDHVNTNDILRIDVDVIQTTPAKGLIITLGFTP